MARSPLSIRLHKILAQQFAKEAGFDPTKRRFIQTTTIAAAALAVGPLRPMASSLIEDLSGRGEPVAIVGAGAAGLAAAWRLKKQRIPFQLFEGSQRVGGRIYSDYQTFSDQGEFCELGGELINTDHHSIRSFAAELGVPVQDLPESDQASLRDIFYYDGHSYSEADVAAAGAPLMRAMIRDNRAIYGAAEQVPITWNCPHAEAAAQFDRISLAEYLDSIPELEHWFKELVKIGYESDTGVPAHSQSVLLLLSYFTGDNPGEFRMFGSSDETGRIQGGNSRLMDAAYKAIGGKVEFGHKLTAVRDTGSKLELSFETAKGAKVLSFSQVILTIPFTVLRQVGGFSDGALQGVDPRVMKSVRELQYGKNSKMMLGFNRRVWKEAGATGTSITNLFTINTWDTSRSQNHSQGILTSFSASQRAERLGREHIPQVITDIETLFPGTQAQHNGKAVVQNWPANPFVQAAYSSPHMGQFTTIVGACDQPLLDSRLFLAGEHTAPYYFGYMEGAVESGFRVADQIRASRRHG